MKDDGERAEQGLLPDDPEADAGVIGGAEPSGSWDPDSLTDGAPLVGALLQGALKVMDDRWNKVEKPVPVPWQRLAEAVGGGLWPGLGVLVGNPGSGKTQLAMQLALHAAGEGIPALYLGLELGKVDLVARLLGMMTGRRWSDFYLGNQPVDCGSPRVADALAALARLPFRLRIVPPLGWSYSELYRETAATADKHGRAPLVVVDYLQIMQGKPGEEIRERVGNAAYMARAVARDLGSVVVLVSSTARDKYAELAGRANPEKTGGGKPAKVEPLGKGDPSRMLGFGKESGEIEFAADSVMVLGSEPWEPGAAFTKSWLALAKLRAVRTSWVELRFDGNRFSEPTAPEEVEI